MSKTTNQLLGSLLDSIIEGVRPFKASDYSIKNLGAERVIRSQDLANLPGLHFNLDDGENPTWLRIQRLVATSPPSTPERLQRFVSGSNDPSAPALGPLKFPEGVEIEATLLELYDKYRKGWNDWAERESPRRACIKLYNQFFAYRLQMQAADGAKGEEIVWGMGLSTWKVKADVSFEYVYPLLSQSLDIVISEKDMAIELRPRQLEVQLELYPLTCAGIPSAAQLEPLLKTQIRDSAEPITPFAPELYDFVMKAVAGTLDSEGRYEEILKGDDQMPAAGPKLITTDSWCILYRPRQNHFQIQDAAALKAALEGSETLPEGPLALVTPPADVHHDHEPLHFRGVSSRPPDGKPHEELYFPLPYNTEQVKIIECLSRSPGVTVQGPPGTGKTHTIANVICHYLANGKKVLVTARRDSALTVLQEKIPEEVRALTVAMIKDDQSGTRQFQASIAAIQHRLTTMNVNDLQEEIKRLQSTINQLHANLRTVDRRMDEIARMELSELDVDGIRLRPAEVAEMVSSDQSRHAWFIDTIDLSATCAPPLTDEEAARFREARRRVGAFLPYAKTGLPDPRLLPDIASWAKLHDSLLLKKTLSGEVKDGTLLEFNSAATDEQLAQLEACLADHFIAVTAMEEAGCEWSQRLRRRCHDSSFGAEIRALQPLVEEFGKIAKIRSELLPCAIVCPGDVLGNAKVAPYIKRAAVTGKAFGLLSFPPSAVKVAVQGITMAGAAPATAKDWQKIILYLEMHRQIEVLEHRWNALAQDLELPLMKDSSKNLRQLEQLGSLLNTAMDLGQERDTVCRKAIAMVFPTASLQLIMESSGISKLRRDLQRHLSAAAAEQAIAYVSQLQADLAGRRDSGSIRIRAMLSHDLGSKTVVKGDLVHRYALIVEELNTVGMMRDDFDLILALGAKVAAAGAENWSLALTEVPFTATGGDDPGLPAHWRESWLAARLRHFITLLPHRKELVELAGKRRQNEMQLASTYRQLVAQTSWVAAKKQATPKVLSALNTFSTSVKKIGKTGTSKSAPIHRRAAKQAMNEAQGAIPCWIMNHSRVSETLPVQIGAFDLVIIDEASQSDLWALTAILRGKKILVVGDDKQVSPDGGFIEISRTESLKARFLADQPFVNMIGPDKSLYDLAASVFAGSQVMLREHFRCVPAIISYCNRNFYDNAILPLRIPKGSERLDPPLIDIHVPDGRRNGRNCNEQEGQAILAEIEAILAAPSMQGRSLGVVTLLGPDQAKYIDTLVRGKCDGSELSRRDFLCGEPPLFQGSERDIMFMSMVADPEHCTALTRDTFEQRFNVAASRARDRLYLVRSVEMSDLSPSCLRRGLLEHFNSKPDQQGGKTQRDLIELCESGFEREFFTRLTDAGYKVTPQVKVGGFRIDMVIEGADDKRLAIELDGDEFHGPDRWAHDTSRQRVLERAGWVFWRCFASTWISQKETVFAELTQQLRSMEIEPLGDAYFSPNMLERREWRSPVLVTGRDSIEPEADDELLADDTEEEEEEDERPKTGTKIRLNTPTNLKLIADAALVLIRQNQSVTCPEVARHCNIPDNKARNILQMLVTRGEIRVNGEKRGTRYLLVDTK